MNDISNEIQEGLLQFFIKIIMKITLKRNYDYIIHIICYILLIMYFSIMDSSLFFNNFIS